MRLPQLRSCRRLITLRKSKILQSPQNLVPDAWGGVRYFNGEASWPQPSVPLTSQERRVPEKSYLLIGRDFNPHVKHENRDGISHCSDAFGLLNFDSAGLSWIGSCIG